MRVSTGATVTVMTRTVVMRAMVGVGRGLMIAVDGVDVVDVVHMIDVVDVVAHQDVVRVAM